MSRGAIWIDIALIGGGMALRKSVNALGSRAFGPLLLNPALNFVRRASTMAAMPTLLTLVIGLIALQILLGWRTIWLPARLPDRRLGERPQRPRNSPRPSHDGAILRREANPTDKEMTMNDTEDTARTGEEIRLTACLERIDASLGRLGGGLGEYQHDIQAARDHVREAPRHMDHLDKVGMRQSIDQMMNRASALGASLAPGRCTG